MRNKADVVIIGGGVVGCAAAYYLTQNGCKDVVLLEKNFLSSGATGSCGAGIRQQWGTEMNCRLSKASMDIFENLEEILDYPESIELKQGGYLILAYTEKEVAQFKKNVALQNSWGIDSQLISAAQAKEIVPHLNTADVLAATFCGSDGHANPFHVTQAYALAAKRQGAEINTFTTCLGIDVENDKIQGVHTSQGYIKTDKVINAAGGYSDLINAMVGIKLPIYSERHQILVTEPVNAFQQPMIISFSYNIYCQQVPHGAFIIGHGDPNEPKGHNIGHSWQFLEAIAKKAYNLLPPLGKLRVIRQWSGLYNISPDRQPVIAEASSLPGFYMAIGFSGHGFMIAPITGIILADIILGQELTIPIKLSANRFEKGELILEPSVV